MRALALRIVVGALSLHLAAAAHSSGPGKTQPRLSSTDVEALRDWPIEKIPKNIWGDYARLDAFIKNNPDEEIRGLYPNPQFQKAVAILAGIGRDRTEPAPRTGEISKSGQPSEGSSHDRRAKGEEEYYRNLGRSLGNQPWPYNESGKGAYQRKDFKAALGDFEKAIRIDPDNTAAMLGFGHSANELGDYKLAMMAARQLLAREPNNPDALGLFYFANGRAPLVNLPTDIFQNAGVAGPPGASETGGVQAVGRDGSSMTSEQVAAAARAQAAAAAPGSAERSASITRDAAAALRVKDYPTAHRLASRAIELNAANAQALNFRAIALTRMQRFNEAVSDASASLALAPGSAAALQTRSWAFAKQGLFQEALKDVEETLTRDASNPYAYQNKAMALAGMKDRAGALEALRRSAELDPRFKSRFERALQLPQEQDLTMLFDEEAATPTAVVPPPRAGKRFARLAVLSAIGGILIALGILHIASAGWREKLRTTIRRALAPSEATGGAAFWLQYELVREIGLGGMGVVYEARDRALERRVAVKKMRDEIRIDPHERRRFVDEAKLVARLRHPNIVDIYTIVEEGSEVYLVFEFVTGRTLQDKIKSEGPMSLGAARGVLHAVSEAVEHAHAARIIHRDLKPSNIMITDDGRVKVMDFGVARLAKDALTKMSMTNAVVGTPAYMAPEQEQGAVRRESDVYALGVCLYEMLTGHPPFSGGGAAMLLNKLNGKHTPPSRRNPALPAALDEVIAKALIPDPDKRFRTPSELVAALDEAIARRA